MKNTKLKLTISIDDVHPEKDWMIIGDKTEKWFDTLHKDYGVKFNLFIPSCYHHKYPISQFKSWINELNSDPKFSCEAHGHYHQTNDPKRFGECEFFELTQGEEIHDRLWVKLCHEWESCGFDLNEMGWRSPGWLCSEASKRYIERTFRYAAIHYEHNRGMQWDCKTFFGHDGIHQENISIHNENMIMFQSHIAGKHNHNVWNEQNYEQLRLSLNHLFEKYSIEPKLLKECLND